MKTSLIAPCGMNCSLCMAYLREKNRCEGCRSGSTRKPYHCLICSIPKCNTFKNSKAKYCFKCDTFPCTRLKQLDKRYRTKYGMNMIANLREIKEKGIRRFVKSERERWKCPECGEMLCVHRKNCQMCGFERIFDSVERYSTN
ncbi:MAG: DUF3795 domain-containing protein [Chitinivibrionales bacterium]|nr:DUF3795 domain-containing protein [Chitinivibrionales bacterium]